MKKNILIQKIITTNKIINFLNQRNFTILKINNIINDFKIFKINVKKVTT